MGFEVAYDPAVNVTFVKVVKKYPVLYNHTKYLPVELKEIAEKAWTEVALELGISESDCKTRWNMIRGCYKRYLKHKIRNEKTKPYYLAYNLHFLLPFINVNRLGENAQRVIDSIVKEDEARHTHEHKFITNDVDLKMDVGNEFEVKLVDSDGEEESYFISTSNRSEDIIGSYNDQSSDWKFFSSLLPDIQRMDVEQKKKFRNALLTTIDRVLYGEEF